MTLFEITILQLFLVLIIIESVRLYFSIRSYIKKNKGVKKL